MIAAVVHVPAEQAAHRDYKTFDVTLRFQYPAWDVVDGILYRDIFATTKREANNKARSMADGDGHLGGGQGWVTFTATEVSNE
ncbi:hypothetical protein D3C85_1661020 [compost metagenome]